jgi:tetratricopeptide (TPR) repeat protein
MAGVFPYGSTEASCFAVALWREILKYEPSDPSGEVREALAFSMMANNELDEALKLVNAVLDLRKESMSFAYGYACLLSRTGSADLSLTWFNYAIAKGYNDIAHAKRDPNLAFLRQVKAEQFADATAVKWNWNIVYGFFNDDITLTNNSAFTITNVTFDVRLEQDKRTWTPKLTAEAIPPGETYTWRNVVSIPGSRLTKSSASVSCDQNQ